MKKKFLAIVLFIICIMGVCGADSGMPAENPVLDVYKHPVADPLEGFNRCMESFNAGCVKYVVAPIGGGYVMLVPKVARDGISNFASNLLYPVSLVNNCLQGKLGDAWHETKRFGINTTVGILGFRDQAGAWGMEPRKEDFGQTFGYYGAGPWFYLNLPFLGPCTGRDGLGRLLDMPFDVTNYIFGGVASVVKVSFAGNELFSSAEALNRYYNDNYDTYSLTRAAYVSYREGLIDDFQFHFTEPEGPLDESLGYMRLKVQDERFPLRAHQRSVQLPGASHRLFYTYWLPEKRDGRLLVILPGIGSHRNDAPMAALAERYVKQGWSVAVLSNTFAADYFLNTARTLVPGSPSQDCVELDEALSLIKADLDSANPVKIASEQQLVLMGLSLGAINTLHLAAMSRKKVARLPFERYIAINPPLDPLAALHRIDDYFDIPLKWDKQTRQQRVKETLHKIALVIKGEKVDLAKVKLTADESRFIIGLNIRLVLADALLAARGKNRIPENVKWDKLKDVKALQRDVLEISFDDYVRHIMGAGLDEKALAELSETQKMTALEKPLKEASNVYLLHNRNDFLVTAEDLAWYEATLGPHAVIFPRGGHLGNLTVPEVQQALDKLVNGR